MNGTTLALASITISTQVDLSVLYLRNHHRTRGLCECTKPSARGLGWKPSQRAQGFGTPTQTKGKVMVPILTQFVTDFMQNIPYLWTENGHFIQKSHVVWYPPFWIFGTLQPQKEENWPNQDWAVFVGSPKPGNPAFWLANNIQPSPGVLECTTIEPNLQSSYQ